MQRVLVTGAAQIGKAGVATIVYKWGQYFDPDVLVYDYLMQSGLPEKKYIEAIRAKGSHIYTMKNHNHSMIDVIRWVEGVIRKHQYKIIHINTDTAYIAAAYIYAAKKAGIRSIYVHSHCTQVDDTNEMKRRIKTALHLSCRPYVCRNTDMFLACSQLAGEWMFRKKNVCSGRYKTIYNGVEVEPYLYDEKVRSQYRKELGISDNCYVLVNIGRFSYQKNHEFLIRVFKEYHGQYPNSLLFLVGDGELRKSIENLVSEYGLNNSVRFLGIRNDVPKLLSAMDCMVMPSRFEGLPVTMVEAQMASLPCVVSGNITREAKFTDPVKYVDGWDKDKWKRAINQFKSDNRRLDPDKLEKSAFNIKNASIELQNILLEK